MQPSAAVEAGQRPVGGVDELALPQRLRRPSAGRVRHTPDEQREQRQDAGDRNRLRAELERPTHSVPYADTMNTGVPMSTRLNSHSASATCMRMQPWETE